MSRFQAIIGRAVRYWFPNETILENYRPPWLFGLEYDFFLPRLSIAIEVQGEQHFRRILKLQTEAQFRSQLTRDARKAALSRRYHVCLVPVRDNGPKTIFELQSKLRRLSGLPLPSIPSDIRFEWFKHSKVLSAMGKRGRVIHQVSLPWKTPWRKGWKKRWR